MKISNPAIIWLLFFFLFLKSLLLTGQDGIGSPVWCLSPVNISGPVIVNWKTAPPAVSVLSAASPARRASSITAVNKCGEPVFHVIHSGVLGIPNNLFIYDLDGNPLLTNATSNGPGLNSKPFSGEIQVVNVPGSFHEWYIIYQEWKTNNGAPLNDGDYTPAFALYSRVSYRCDSIYVLERDIPITVSGNAYTYTNAKALSFLPDNPGQLCLYSVRRTSGNSDMSIDRFLITQNGIEFDRNTGNISADNWNLSISGSPIEISSDGRRIAINNRDQSTNGDTFFTFDAVAFNNGSSYYKRIDLGDLMLQPDNIVVMTEASVDNIASSNPSLQFLQNMESKILEIEFSPDGRFLYFATGGFAGGGLTCTTYLGQIDLGPVDNPAPYPYDLRLQIQIPAGNFNPNDGSGGYESQYPDTYYPIWFVEKAYNEAMYFIKRNSPYLYAIPFPDQPMPQCLVPGEIDLSDVSHPNILVQGKLWNLPDHIDGYDYEKYLNPSISLGNDTVICAGDNIILTPGGQFESYCWHDGSSAPVFTATEPGTYWVEVIDESGCTDSDSIIVLTMDESISIGDDIQLCMGDSLVLTPGAGFSQYLWQDGSVNSSFLVKESGLYWVEVRAGSGCKASDSANIVVEPLPVVFLGNDTILELGETISLDAGQGFESYYWQNGSSGQYSQVTSQGLYWVIVGNGFCFATDSIFVIYNDCEASLTMPNCFTPNGDGTNENFNVISANLTNFNMLIFNRWGQLLFETNDINEGWDGKVNGIKCPVGTYFYLVKYNTFCSTGLSKSGEKTGSVTLLE